MPPAEALLLSGVPSAGGGPTQLATHTLVNTSGSTVNAGGFTGSFGHPFKKGDVPSGTAPIFKVGSTAQPYSWGGQVYWSDGSLKWARFKLRLTSASIAGSGTLAVGVWNGGTAPAASGLVIADFYGQQVVVSGTGLGANFGLTGNWGAWLSSANAANITAAKTIITLDGDVGQSRSFWIEMSGTEGGAAHGALVCQIDMDILLNAGGARAYHEVLFDVCQPYYSDSSHASGEASGTKPPRAFSSLGWSVNGGSVNPWPFPFTAQSFTAPGGTTDLSTPGNNGYYTGNGGWSTIPCTVSGLTGTGLSTTQLYYITVPAPGTPNTRWQITAQPDGSNALLPTAGSGTVTPVLVSHSFCHLFGADATGKANFFQGTGNVTSRPTIRTQYDKTYFRSTGLIDYYDMTFSCPATNFAAWDPARAWTPFTYGPYLVNFTDTGDRIEIGVFTGWAAWHFFNQGADDEYLQRTLALSAGAWAVGQYDSTTKTVPNLKNKTYTDMAASTTLFSNISGSYTPQVPFYAMGISYVAAGGGFTSHNPPLTHYPYLVFGEPAYQRMAIEWAIAGLANFGSDGPSQRNPTFPATYYGVPTWIGQLRSLAWQLRDDVDAAALCPAAWAESPYLKDIIADAFAYFASQSGTAPLDSSYYTTNGAFSFYEPLHTPRSTASISSGSAWQESYLNNAIVRAVSAMEDANALAWLNQRKIWILHKFATWGGFPFNSYYDKLFNGGGNPGSSYPPITQDSEYGISGIFSSLFWTGGHFVLGPPLTPVAAIVLQNNDKIYLDWNTSIGATPAGFAIGTTYYVRNLSGSFLGNYTFDLSGSFNGPPITIAGTGNTDGQLGTFCQLQSWPVAGVVGSCQNYINNALSLSAFRRMKNSAGITGLTALLTDLTTRYVDGTTAPAGAFSYADDPKSAIAA